MTTWAERTVTDDSAPLPAVPPVRAVIAARGLDLAWLDLDSLLALAKQFEMSATGVLDLLGRDPDIGLEAARRLLAVSVDLVRRRAELGEVVSELSALPTLDLAAVERASGLAGVPLRDTLKGLLRGAVENDEIERAVMVLELALSARIHPGDWTAVQALIGVARRGEPDRAVDVWLRLRSEIGLTEDRTTARLFDDLANAGRPDLLERVVSAIRSSGTPSTSVTSALLKAYATAGDSDAALAFFESLTDTNSYHLKHVLVALCADRRVDEVLRLVASAPDEALTGHVASPVLELITESRVDALEPVLQRFGEARVLHARDLSTVVDRLAGHGEWRPMPMLLELARRFDVRMSQPSLSRVVRGLAKEGDRHGALAIAREHGVVSRQAYLAILSEDGRIGDRTHAVEVVSAMVALGLHVGGDELRCVGSGYRANLATVNERFDALTNDHHAVRTTTAQWCGAFVLAVGMAYVDARMAHDLPTVLAKFDPWAAEIRDADIDRALKLLRDSDPAACAQLVDALDARRPIGSRSVWTTLAETAARAGRPDLVSTAAKRCTDPDSRAYWDLVELGREYWNLGDKPRIGNPAHYRRPGSRPRNPDGRISEELDLFRYLHWRDPRPNVGKIVGVLGRLTDPPLPPIVARLLVDLGDTPAEIGRLLGALAAGRTHLPELRDARIQALRRIGAPPSTGPLFEAVVAGVPPTQSEIDWFAVALFPEQAERRVFEASFDAGRPDESQIVGHVYRSAAKALAARSDAEGLEKLVGRFSRAGVEPDRSIWLARIRASGSSDAAMEVLQRLEASTEVVEVEHLVAVIEHLGTGDHVHSLVDFVVERSADAPAFVAARLLAHGIKACLERDDLEAAEGLQRRATDAGLDLGAGARRSLIVAQHRAKHIDDNEMRSQIAEVATRDQLDRADQLRHIVHDLSNLTGPLFLNLKEFGAAVRADDFVDASELAAEAVSVAESFRQMIDHWKLVASPPVDVGDDARVSVSWVAKRIEQLLGSKLADAQIEMSLSIPPLPSGRPAEVAMSAEQLDIALRNLVQNSFKALQGCGGGRIDVEATYLDHLPVIGSSPTGGWIVIVVRDDGPGIPKEFRDSIQESGVTLDAQGAGLGWGLYLMTRVVASVGGTWRFTSATADEAGAGASFTEFELALPVAPRAN